MAAHRLPPHPRGGTAVRQPTVAPVGLQITTSTRRRSRVIPSQASSIIQEALSSPGMKRLRCVDRHGNFNMCPAPGWASRSACAWCRTTRTRADSSSRCCARYILHIYTMQAHSTGGMQEGDLGPVVVTTCGSCHLSPRLPATCPDGVAPTLGVCMTARAIAHGWQGQLDAGAADEC